MQDEFNMAETQQQTKTLKLFFFFFSCCHKFILLCKYD